MLQAITKFTIEHEYITHLSNGVICNDYE